MADTDFVVTFENFEDGFSPLAHIDNKTFKGSKGQASEMKADVISNPGFIQQSPALADLTNGNQAGVVTEPIRYILDKPTASDTTFAVGTSKLFKLSSTTVASGGSPTSWPQTIKVTMESNTHSVQLVRSSSQYAYITDASQKGLDLSGDFTIEAWVKIGTAPSSGQIYTIVSKYNESSQIAYRLAYQDVGTKQIRVRISQNGSSVTEVTWIYTLTAGTWYHLAVTCDISQPTERQFELFINGVSKGKGFVVSDAKVTSIFNSSASFAIGASFSSGSPTNFFDGKLNNVRVWNRVRPANKILYAKDRLITNAYGLLGCWYVFDDHIDSSPLDNSLTASGNPTFSTDVPFASADLPMTEGESIVRLKNNLFILYNRAYDGDIAVMSLTDQYEVIYADWGTQNDMELEKAKHPVAAKEDIMVFGNGRYLGVYIEGSNTLDTRRLDFGEGAEVADVVFHANMWWIAVNYGEGRRSQIYLYDGSAMSNILSDEVGLGSQRIGFLYVLNGIVYVAYDDLTADGFAIGWVSGRQIKPLRYFSGTLPDHRQKTLYKSTILFVSGSDIYSFGAPVEQLPIQISRLTSGGYANVEGIAAPFGVPMVSSYSDSNYRLAKFSGLSTSSNWKSIFVDVTKNRSLGKIHTVIVNTKALASGARADLTIEGNQGDKTSNTMQITGTGKTRHVFRTINLPAVEDMRVVVDYQNGSTSNNCPIRKIVCLGNFVER